MRPGSLGTCDDSCSSPSGAIARAHRTAIDRSSSHQNTSPGTGEKESFLKHKLRNDDAVFLQSRWREVPPGAQSRLRLDKSKVLLIGGIPLLLQKGARASSNKLPVPMYLS